MTLKRKVALIVAVGVLVLGFGAVRFALAVDNDMKQVGYEIRLAQDSLKKTHTDWQSMVDQGKNVMHTNFKGDTVDQEMGKYMDLQASVVADLLEANQHTVNAVEVLEKHFTK